MNFRNRRLVFAGVAVLLAIHFALAVGSKIHESTTSDEIAHLVGGLSYWQYNDYRFQPENGNLPQRWAAIPAALHGTKMPPLAGNENWAISDAWGFGHQLFYETGEDHFPRLMAGRAMIALFSVATGLLIFLWSRRLFGLAGAFISLVFFAFSPSFLAHGALVTSDVCMAFFMVASVGLWWKHLHDGKTATLLASAAVFALACVAKFSAPLLLPIMLVLAVVRLASPPPLVLLGRECPTLGAKVGRVTLSFLIHGAMAVAVIWASFGFRYSGFNPALPPADHYIQSFAEIQGVIGWQGKVIHAMSVGHLLPEAYLYGYTFVIEMSYQRAAYLDGMYSIYGWRDFFVRAFLYKATLPFLAACLLVAAAGLARWRRGAAGLWQQDLYRVAPLLALFVVYWGVSVAGHLNIGERHLLPTYPVLLIGLGALGSVLVGRSKLAAAAVAALLLWHAGEAVAIAPDFLPYFNEAAGGSSAGYLHLADSSVDWGQDLPGLATWLNQNRHPDEPVFLSYFGSGEPTYYGINAQRLPFINGFRTPDPFQQLRPGLYCVGETMLTQVYGESRGPWTLALEKDYEQLRALEPLLLAKPTDIEARKRLDAQIPKAVRAHALRRYLGLRFARLCFYLRIREADAQIGHSILVYRLSAAELHAATGGSLREWADLLAATAGARVKD